MKIQMELNHDTVVVEYETKLNYETYTTDVVVEEVLYKGVNVIKILDAETIDHLAYEIGCQLSEQEQERQMERAE